MQCGVERNISQGMSEEWGWMGMDGDDTIPPQCNNKILYSLFRNGLLQLIRKIMNFAHDKAKCLMSKPPLKVSPHEKAPFESKHPGLLFRVYSMWSIKIVNCL